MLKYPRLRRHIVGTNFPTTLTMGNIYQTYYFTPKNEAGITKRDPLSVIFFTARWPLRKDSWESVVETADSKNMPIYLIFTVRNPRVNPDLPIY